MDPSHGRIALAIAGFLAASIVGWGAADLVDTRKKAEKLARRLAVLEGQVAGHERAIGYLVGDRLSRVPGDSFDGERVHR